MSLRLVCDTNVLVSAFMFGGKPRVIFNAVLENKFELVTSMILLEELEGVLSGPKLKQPYEFTQVILKGLMDVALLVRPSQSFAVIKTDPDDNRVLECAVEGQAEVIISGDKDLLILKKFFGIPIMSPTSFIEIHMQ